MVINASGNSTLSHLTPSLSNHKSSSSTKHLVKNQPPTKLLHYPKTINILRNMSQLDLQPEIANSTGGMASSSSSVFAILSLVLTLLNPAKSYGLVRPGKEGHKALYVFGDSLFDPGNNQYLNSSVNKTATYWPYGETYFKRPTGRLSDGRIVPDLLAQFAKLPIIPPYLQPGIHRFIDGANFASAGAGVLDETNPGTIPLGTQLSYFKNMKKILVQKLGDVEAENFLNRAVYLFSIGGNDYFSLYTSSPNATQSHWREYVSMVIGNLTSVLKEVYELGGRKIVFQNAGPLGCLPSMKARNLSLGDRCAEMPMALARMHNRDLAAVLKKLETELPGFKYSIFDYYNALGQRINNPKRYGLKEGKAACCGTGPYRGMGCGGNGGIEKYELCSNPGEYVWFDGGHTTENTNLQLAKLIWNGIPDVTGPYNMKKFFE